MGGGIGLMAGASHRVVTERSRLAMPEITVGLYPDVGGTWVLGHMPGRIGLFLALTGAPLNASDALFTGLADYAVRETDKTSIVDALLSRPWTAARSENDRLLTRLLNEFSASPDGDAGPAQRHFELIATLRRRAPLSDAAAAIQRIGVEDPWLGRAAATLEAGSPSSAALAHALQERTRQLSLADVFRIELVASLHCAA